MAWFDSPIFVYNKQDEHRSKWFAPKPCCFLNSMATHGTNDVFDAIRYQIQMVNEWRKLIEFVLREISLLNTIAFFSYKTVIESQETPQSESFVASTSNHCNDNNPMDSRHLKDLAKHLLKEMTKEQANDQFINLTKLYQRQPYGYDKFLYMVDLNTAEWEKNKRNRFLQWYAKLLRKIVEQPWNVARLFVTSISRKIFIKYLVNILNKHCLLQ